MKTDFTKLMTGFNSHRLIDDDPYYKKECDFVKTINEDITLNRKSLAQIVNMPNHRAWLEEKDEKIVLSVIQWLGTPVGQDFICRAQSRYDEA